jgi:hypothetical protein
MWVMLNPSIADARKDDNTIRRVINFSAMWGFGALVVVNLYAFRSTDPRGLMYQPDPIGPENQNHIRQHAMTTSRVVCAWGCKAKRSRVQDVVVELRLIRQGCCGSNALYCLGTSKDDHPLHPLRLRKDTELREYAAL